MSRIAVASSARNGFILGLCAGMIATSAFFLSRAELAAMESAGGLAATSTAPGMSPAPAMGTSDATAGSMDAATLALKTRLAAQGGPDEQWELLAQSYDFLGRTVEAKLAREHKTSAAGTLGDAVAASVALLPAMRSATMAASTSRIESGESATLLARAEQHRRQREFKEACAAYAAVARLGAMTADTWADYADAQASLAGGLAGTPEKAIDSALAARPAPSKGAVAQGKPRARAAPVPGSARHLAAPAGGRAARLVRRTHRRGEHRRSHAPGVRLSTCHARTRASQGAADR